MLSFAKHLIGVVKTALNPLRRPGTIGCCTQVALLLGGAQSQFFIASSPNGH
jgi:hypothetical protein